MATLTQTQLPIHMPRCCHTVTREGHLACRTAAGPTQEPRPIIRTAPGPTAPHPNFTFSQEALAFVSFMVCASVCATLLRRELLPSAPSGSPASIVCPAPRLTGTSHLDT